MDSPIESKGSPQTEPTSSERAALTLTHLFNRLQPAPETTVLFLAVLIGTGAGAGVVILRFLIHTIHQLAWGEVSSFLSTWGHWTLALIPILGGMIVGGLRWWLKDFGPGLTTLLAMVKSGGEIMPLKPVAKMVTAAISLGSGASLGPEGPSVEIGANLSLLLGQVLKVSQERQQLLLGAGAAAGLAAGFNAPIAGVFFALEVVLGTAFANSAVSVVLLAAVVAAWIAQIGLGFQPAFSLPAYEVRSLLELPLYAGLGLLASVTSVIYKKSMAIARQSFQGQVPGVQWLAKIPQPLHPILGGACVGVVALAFPQILGVGYETVESILQDVQFPLRLVVALLVIKLVMTAISFGSGFVGGVFAPALFLGASLGSAYGKLLAIAFPMLHTYMATPPAYAMVGMAAVLAGSVRAPLTSILLLFELTRDYRIVLPLMGAVGLSIWLVERIEPKVILDAQSEPKEESPQFGENLTVGDVMVASPLRLSAELTLEEAAQLLIAHEQHCGLVENAEQALIGILTLQDINRLLRRNQAHSGAEVWHQPIEKLCTAELLFAQDDEPLRDAIARMSGRGLHQLPVVSQSEPQRAIGLLTREHAELVCTLRQTQTNIRHHVAADGAIATTNATAPGAASKAEKAVVSIDI